MIVTVSGSREGISANRKFSPEDMVDNDGPLSGIERTEFTKARRKFSRESLLDWICGGVEIRNNIDGVRTVPLESLLDRDLIVTVSGSKGGIGPDSWFSPEDMVDKDGTLSGIERTEFTKAERKFSRESLLDWIGGGGEMRTNINGVRRVPPESLLDRDLIVTVSGSRRGIGADSWFSPEDMVDHVGTLSGIERTAFTKAERKFPREPLLDWIGRGVEIGKIIDGVRRVPPESLPDTDMIYTIMKGRAGIKVRSVSTPNPPFNIKGTCGSIEVRNNIDAESSFTMEYMTGSEYIPAAS